MRKQLHYWLVLGFLLCVVVGAATWVSWTALKLERARTEVAAQAEHEEKVRLALWRMESIVTPLIARESSLPPHFFSPFYLAEAAFDPRTNLLPRTLLPSPLLSQPTTLARLHFEMDPNGLLSSPQVPTGRTRQFEIKMSRGGFAEGPSRLKELSKFISKSGLESALEKWQVETQFSETRFAVAQPTAGQNPAVQQALRNTMEQQARVQSFNQVAYGNNNYDFPFSTVSTETPPTLAAIWIDDQLLAVRKVFREGELVFQGTWLDWPPIRSNLLASVTNLFPAGTVRPLPSPDRSGLSRSRQLASLPLIFEPNTPPSQSTVGSKELRRILWLAWFAVVLAVAGTGWILYGMIALAERRAAFVSAVTHELRTPLTTFKMYSEMLAAEMVPEEKRRRYLETLSSEANRLNHLVENVLAYARLERGSARRKLEKISVGQLIERVVDRLRERANQGGMELVIDSDPAVTAREVEVDVAVVEQILFNLVDNACKYGLGAADGIKRIHLEALPGSGERAMLRVRDHGTGIGMEQRRQLFQPFSKSAEQAAGNAPGIGLGLALCRRLSRSFGGDLVWDKSVSDGAAFVLLLPKTQV